MSFEIAIVAAILGLTGFFAFLATRLDETMAMLKTFFLLLSFLFVAVGLFVIRDIAEQNYSTAIFNIVDVVYIGYLYVFSFLVFYFIVMFMINAVSLLRGKRLQEKEDE